MKRVVVTGMGTVNALGHNVKDFWAAIKAGKCGIGPITKFDPTEFPCKIAAEIKDFDYTDLLEKKEARMMDDFSIFTVHAAKQALRDAGVTIGENQDAEKVGAIIGNGIGGIMSLELAYQKLFAGGGPSRIPPLTIPKHIANIASGNVAIHTGAKGPNCAVVTACSAGTDAIGTAAMWIRSGKMEMMITGGSEAPISQLAIGGFCQLKAMSTGFNDRPLESSRPFDKGRDGFIIGEAAGILILEEYEHAVKRGAKIYAELAGFGMTCDAYHLTSPHSEGEGAIRAIQMALNEGGLKPQDVDYINAHGTSTPINDPTETKAIKKVFGEHAYKLKVSSTKSMTGHCIGGAGGIEAIVAIMAIQDQVFPPTINLQNPDIEAGCDLDYVPNKAVSGKIDVAMSNTLGFGGHNGIVVFKRV